MIGRLARTRPGLTWVMVISAFELLAVTARISAPIQPALGVLFVLTCPGFLLLDLDRPRDPGARIMLGIGGSVAINVVIVTLALVVDAGPIALVLVFALAMAALMPRERLARVLGRARSWLGTWQAPAVEVADVPPTEPVAGSLSEPSPVVTPEPLPDPTPEPAPVPESYPPAVVVLGVDINRADVGPFTGLPGIGPELASRIVAHRDENGPFADVNALLDVLRGMAIEEEARKI